MTGKAIREFLEGLALGIRVIVMMFGWFGLFAAVGIGIAMLEGRARTTWYWIVILVGCVIIGIISCVEFLRDPKGPSEFDEKPKTDHDQSSSLLATAIQYKSVRQGELLI
jgi:hypothetical protein